MSSLRAATLFASLCLAIGADVSAWPTEFIGIKEKQEYADAWGVRPAHEGTAFARNGILQAYLVTSSVPANVLWPGDKPRFTFQFTNLKEQPVKAAGRARIVQYEVITHPGGDVFDIGLRKVRDVGSQPLAVDVPAKGWQDVTVQPDIPEAFGGYAVIIDLDGQDPLFGATCVRTFRPEAKTRQFHRLAMDMAEIDALVRLGATVNRVGIGYKPTTDADYEAWYQHETQYLRDLRKAGLPVCIEFGGGAWFQPNQPLGRPRPWLDDGGTMTDTKFDLAWLPSSDPDFKKFAKRFLVEYGWPNGPVNAVKLWNEPWNGISISGWGADDERYREIFSMLGEARDEAAAVAGVKVLVGGCDSSSNTFDKLFADGKTGFLKWLDFLSIHYQGTDPHTTVKMWVDRKDANSQPSRVLVWDTESWVANSDDRIAGVLAAMFSFGQDRVVGIQSDAVVGAVQWRDVAMTGGGTEQRKVLQTWSPGAAVGAFQHFVGERPFRELLFANGLPFVFVFDAEADANGHADPEDATVVVLGDMGAVFGFDNVMFRTCRSLEEVRFKQSLRVKLAGLAPDAPERADMEARLAKPLPYAGVRMTLKADEKRYGLYDFYGNPVPAEDGLIAIPLDARGFYLRGKGSRGCFDALLAALRGGRIEGLEPLAKACSDMTAPIARKPSVRLKLTNVLNRPVNGALRVTLGDLAIAYPKALTFQPHETQTVEVEVTGGEAVPSNLYPLSMLFDAGSDGIAVHDETMRVNWISRKTIDVDGRLDDWQDAIPQTLRVEGRQEATLTEKAWLPFQRFDESLKKGLAVAYLAYDDANFYFAARVADTTPDPGTVRFEKRNDDEYFYPQTSYVVRLPKAGIAPFREGETEAPKALVWPDGVRRYSYRKAPVLPSGNAPAFDNVQIAFNVLPPDRKPLYPSPPGTMPGYIAYSCTDYEYALNKVAEVCGGGTEIWRLRRPDMPHKHFYPRQPASPADGPVQDGKLAVVHEGGTRVTECAIPWREIPDVRKCLDAGKPIKFSFRVNDNDGVGCMELSRGRSVAKRNGSFRADWVEHWANEVAFGWER